ncbi:MAG: thiamine pyrophosphokinase [Candidatus Thermoplasmatota archaeon]|nr:thiamine pyrophosphokinase [Candidatus Thermoplasmatota archaeon]
MKAILWCNGENPDSSILDEVLSNDAEVFGVDGGADKAAEEGVLVNEVLGDLDSIDITRWKGEATELFDQNNSDLAKAIEVLTARGYTEIDVIGTEGGTSSHILGNWAALCDAPGGARIRIHHNDSITSRFHPDDEEMEFLAGEGEVFSVFALVPGKVWISGARWDIQGEHLGMSTRGMNNEGSGGIVSLRSEGVLAVIRPR